MMNLFMRCDGGDTPLKSKSVAAARNEVKRNVKACDYNPEGGSFFETVHIFKSLQKGDVFVETLKVWVDLEN